jgi:hypothetical protein
MSTSVETLKPKVHVPLPFIAAAVFVLFAAATIGVYALSTRTGTESATSTTISGTAANTPTELRGGILELRGGRVEAATSPVVRPFGRAAVQPRVGEITSSANTPPLGTVISSTSGSILPRAKQLGVDVVAAGISPASVDIIAARNAMLASYQQTSSAAFIAARNAMLASYQMAPNDEIVVNGEVCQICWKYR